jgi:hypothetical protein
LRGLRGSIFILFWNIWSWFFEYTKPIILDIMFLEVLDVWKLKSSYSHKYWVRYDFWNYKSNVVKKFGIFSKFFNLVFFFLLVLSWYNFKFTKFINILLNFFSYFKVYNVCINGLFQFVFPWCIIRSYTNMYH